MEPVETPSAIELVIGYEKGEHQLERNRLKGVASDMAQRDSLTSRSCQGFFVPLSCDSNFTGNVFAQLKFKINFHQWLPEMSFSATTMVFLRNIS